MAEARLTVSYQPRPAIRPSRQTGRMLQCTSAVPALTLTGRLFADDAGRHGYHRGQIAEMPGNDESRTLLRQLAKLAHIFLADPQLHGLDSAALIQRITDPAQTLGCGGCNRQDRGGLTLGFVDLLLLARLGRLDDPLLLA